DAGRACCRGRTPRSRHGRSRGGGRAKSDSSSGFLETHGDRLAAGFDEREAGGIQATRDTVLLVGQFEFSVAGTKCNLAAPRQGASIVTLHRPVLAVDR